MSFLTHLWKTIEQGRSGYDPESSHDKELTRGKETANKSHLSDDMFQEEMSVIVKGTE